jgi:hypothetical protein
LSMLSRFWIIILIEGAAAVVISKDRTQRSKLANVLPNNNNEVDQWSEKKVKSKVTWDLLLSCFIINCFTDSHYTLHTTYNTQLPHTLTTLTHTNSLNKINHTGSKIIILKNMKTNTLQTLFFWMPWTEASPL